MRYIAELAVGVISCCAVSCTGDDDGRRFHVEMPRLVSTSPAEGDTVARTQWLVLTFDEAPEVATSEEFELRCGSTEPAFEATALSDGRVVLNPAMPLPESSRCTTRWLGPDGVEQVSFQVAARGDEALVPYERNGSSSLLPLPDDVWVTPDESTATGVRIGIPELDVSPGGPLEIGETFRLATLHLDGWSPIAHWVVQLEDEPDPATLPYSPADSLDPVSTIALFDLSDGERVPFYLWNMNETNADGSDSHVLVIWPAQQLSPAGRYGLVVSNRVLVNVERPLEASPFMRAALAGGETEYEQRAATMTQDVLDVAGRADVPFHDDDVALVLRATIRTLDDIVDEHLAVWEQVRDMADPEFVVTEVEEVTDTSSDVAAYVRGTWVAPSWVDEDRELYLRRDPDTGLPVAEGSWEVPFVMALPRASLDGPAPVVMFQHGQPGDAESQVPCEARTHLAGAGFAVAGFTNYRNRDLEESVARTLQEMLLTGEWPDTQPSGPVYLGEQLSFVRLLRTMGDLDVLPIGAPDGVPDIDATSLLYLGQSAGGGQALSLLAFEPSIVAAALNVPGARSWVLNLYQEEMHEIYATVTSVYPAVTRPFFYAGTVMAQMLEDSNDAANVAWLVHRSPLDLGAGGKRASILMTEGLNDILVPPESTRPSAWALGLPMVEPALDPEPFLDVVEGGVSGNLGEGTTGGFVQFDPADRSSTIEYCAPSTPDPEDGHQYTQDAPAARSLRIRFFQTALTEAAPIIENYSTP